MYKPYSLKGQLVQFLKDNGQITRKEAYNWSKKHGYEQATTERRLREMVNEIGVIPLNDRLKPANVFISEHITAYRWKPTTVFYKKLLC